MIEITIKTSSGEELCIKVVGNELRAVSAPVEQTLVYQGDVWRTHREGEDIDLDKDIETIPQPPKSKKMKRNKNGRFSK